MVTDDVKAKQELANQIKKLECFLALCEGAELLEMHKTEKGNLFALTQAGTIYEKDRDDYVQ